MLFVFSVRHIQREQCARERVDVSRDQRAPFHTEQLQLGKVVDWGQIATEMLAILESQLLKTLESGEWRQGLWSAALFEGPSHVIFTRCKRELGQNCEPPEAGKRATTEVGCKG